MRERLTVHSVHRAIEEWAPRDIAWEKDNIGILVGNPEDEVRGIVVALDCTEAVIRETIQHKANLLITHHPLLFKPLRSVTSGTSTGRCVQLLTRGGINLIGAHTNIDFTSGGTSFALAEKLGLRDIDFLDASYELDRKIVTFVPADSAEQVANAMSDAGAGRIGNYEQCSFRSDGTGTFMGNNNTKPARGKKLRREQIEEVRLEMILKRRDTEKILQALRQSHPYEEPAYDMYPLGNISREYGMGAIGHLPRKTTLASFLSMVRRQLSAKAVRFSGSAKTVQRIAVCGGSGSQLLEKAIQRRADVFVTADVSYHTFHDALGRIVLVDAGHYETELPVVPVLASTLQRHCINRGAAIPVRVARSSTNPMQPA